MLGINKFLHKCLYNLMYGKDGQDVIKYKMSLYKYECYSS